MSSEGFRVVGASNTLPSSREVDQIIVDHIAVMLKQESAQYSPCFDYLSVHRDLQPSSEHVNENWRRKICEWAFEVTDHFGFDREVVSIALNYLDRVIAHTTISACCCYFSLPCHQTSWGNWCGGRSSQKTPNQCIRGAQPRNVYHRDPWDYGTGHSL